MVITKRVKWGWGVEGGRPINLLKGSCENKGELKWNLPTEIQGSSVAKEKRRGEVGGGQQLNTGQLFGLRGNKRGHSYPLYFLSKLQSCLQCYFKQSLFSLLPKKVCHLSLSKKEWLSQIAIHDIAFLATIFQKVMLDWKYTTWQGCI